MIQESGRSMIEMLGVLAIMGLITVGAIRMVSVAMKSSKRSVVSDEVIQMVSGVRTLLAEYDGFDGINNDTIFNVIGMSPKNSFGGVYRLSVDPNNSKQFIVSIEGLSKSDCEYFVSKAWTGSVDFESSDGKLSGASGNCIYDSDKNSIHIKYGK